MTEVYLPFNSLTSCFELEFLEIELVVESFFGARKLPRLLAKYFWTISLRVMGVTRHSSLVSLVAGRPCSVAAHDHGIGILARLCAIRFTDAARLQS